MVVVYTSAADYYRDKDYFERDQDQELKWDNLLFIYKNTIICDSVLLFIWKAESINKTL